MTTTPPKTSDKIITIATLGLLGLAVAQGGFVLYKVSAKAPAQTLPLPPDALDMRGKVFPALDAIQPVAGASLAHEQQAPTTIVAFLRTTCPACNSAKPTLEAMKRKYGDKLGFVAIYGEPKKTVAAYNAKLPRFVDAKKTLAKQLKIDGVPTFYAVQNGKVKYQMIGWSPEVGNDLEALAKGGSK